MRFLLNISILSGIVIFIDLYCWKNLVSVIKRKKDRRTKYISIIYWLITSFFIGNFIFISLASGRYEEPQTLTYFFYTISFFILTYIPKLIFLSLGLVTDIFRLVINLAQKKHLKYLRLKKYLFFTALLPIPIMLYGMFYEKNNFKTEELTLEFNDLPPEFDGFKVVQISDIHSGSYCNNEKPFEKAIQLINQAKPDIVVMSGDLVNNLSNEADFLVPLFKKLKTKEGMFAVLGNHDYGDYYHWKNEAEKRGNLEKIKENYRKCGFYLLQNENITIKRGSDSIFIAGTDNWGLPPFRQDGIARLALKNVPEKAFCLFVSHDPSHWTEVLSKSPLPDLTLSGHTHGMQFGLVGLGIHWSPASLRYPKWGGLYEGKLNRLYVNRGFGVIGFMGRIFMPPEITVLTLKRK